MNLFDERFEPAAIHAVSDYAQDGEFLRALTYVPTAQNSLDELTRFAVAGARADGRSWQSIGHALGISKQAAQQRFSVQDGTK